MRIFVKNHEVQTGYELCLTVYTYNIYTMKKILFALLILLSICRIYMAGAQNPTYSIRMIKSEEVLVEINVSSHAFIDSTVSELCDIFPTADRIEVESV